MSPDPSPRFLDHPDKGCRIAPSCLACPLKTCILDDPRASQRQATQARYSAIKAALRKGHSSKEVAATFDLNVRTVQKVRKGV